MRTRSTTAASSLRAPATDAPVHVAWDASTAADLAGYVLQYSTAPDSGWITIASITTPGYDVTGLAADTTYYFHVAAVDSTGNQSAWSATVSTTTPLPSG